MIMERIYEKGLYDLDLEGILRYLGHDNNTFIGQVKREDNKFFLVNLYSDDEEQKGKLLVDLLYGDNIRVSIEKSIELDENNFYKIRIFLFLKETRLAQGTPFLFFAQIIENVQRNPYEIDVDQAFKKNDNPSSNRNLVRTLAEVGRGMYSLKDRMFFELIQNADDASSKGGVLLDVFTEGDYLIISHDGFNFDRNDFKAINSSANGTKKANENKTGYKGIGFKSVFTDSEEVFIKTGGYQFKFDKHDSRFSDFESFYFFVREINSEESRTNFLNKFADEKKEFNGVKDIPWQIVPIWVDKFPDELFPYFTKNVSIALKLGKNNIEGDKGYKKAIEEIIENPKFVLFLRNTKQILFNGGIIRKKENDNKIILENSKGNSIDTFERRNFEIKFDEKTFEKRKIDIRIDLKKDNENDKPISVFVDLKREEIENIPKKISMNNATEISFAVATFGADGGINPDKKCSNISLFAFLPTLVKDFKFPFYINANFILDSPRQRILGDNPWNCFLMQEIAIQMVNWCAELSARGEKNALNILITKEFSERDADTRQLAENFNEYYRRALEEIPFILNQSGKIVKQEDIIIDDTSLSKIIGADLFCEILDTQKQLPSSKIDISILEENIFEDIEHISTKDVISIFAGNTTLNDWFIDADDTEKEHFYEWLIDNEAEEIVNLLPIFSFENQWISYKEYQDSNSYLITTNKIAPIKGILSKLDYQCSDNLLEEHPLKDFFNYTGEEWLFENIVKQEITSLLAEEKLELIKALREFNGVGKESIAKMVIFCNIEGEAKPLNQMLPYREEYPDWLAPYIISKEENFSELREYLVKEEDEFSQIIWNILEKIEIPISVLYNEYKWTDSRYTKKLIDKKEYSEEALLPIIEEADKNTQQYFLNSISKIELSEGAYYTKESSTYRILQLALKVYDDISDFTKKIFFEDRCIREFSVKDEVICTYKEDNVEKRVIMHLSRLLPEYHQSDATDKIKKLFEDEKILYKFFEAKEKNQYEICNEIEKITSNELSAYQYLFIIYYKREKRKYYNRYVPNIDLAQTTEDFVFDITDFLCQNKIKISSTVPFTYHLWTFFYEKYFNNEYILDTERLLPNIEKWANTPEKKSYLKSNGVRGEDDRNIQFRKSFVENTPFGIDKLNKFTDSEILSSIDYFFKREDLQKPFTGEYQTYIVNKISSFKYIRIDKRWDLLETQEWITQEYVKWRERHYTRIFLFNGVFPIDVFYKGNFFIRYFENEKYLYNYSTKILYINDKENMDDVLFIIAREGKMGITLDDYQTLCREGKVMISQEDAQKLKHYNEIKKEKEALEEKNKSLEAELERFRRLSSIQTPPVEADIQENTQQTSEEYTTNKVLYKGNLSKEEQIDAHKEAVLKSKKALEKAGYDCSKWILDEENDSPGFWQSYSQVCGCIKNPQREDVDIVVKSAKGGTIHLSATDLDLLVADKHNILMVWDGTTAHSITNEELFGQNSNINLVFDTKNTPYEYYSALSGFFKYIKGTTFVIENPKRNIHNTVKSFGLDVKQEGTQDLLTDEDL
jgi:hypothetical protein